MTIDLWIDHSGPQYLQPTTLLTNPATLAATDHTGNVHLGRRLSKGKETGTQTHACFLSEKLIGKNCQHALKVTKSDALVHHQSFNLMKHRGMGCIRIAAIDRPGGNNSHRRLLLEHGTNLNWRSMSAQQQVIVYKKGILHVARRMLGWKIECLKVVPVVLNFRTFSNRKTKPGKNVADLFNHQCNGMFGSTRQTPARQGNINPLRLQALKNFQVPSCLDSSLKA